MTGFNHYLNITGELKMKKITTVLLLAITFIAVSALSSAGEKSPTSCTPLFSKIKIGDTVRVFLKNSNKAFSEGTVKEVDNAQCTLAVELSNPPRIAYMDGNTISTIVTPILK